MKFLIAERISANKYKTPEGYLVCVDSVLARTGKQTYRKNEIFVDCNDDTEIEVDRKPEEVFSEATLASFENKPITIEHPDEDVNTGNFKNLAVGFVRDIHRGKDNGQDVMLGTLVITDEEAISAVESGELLDLSCGYDCDIEDSANPQQRNIRGNHVALCENGRAGIARIVDSVKDKKLNLPSDYEETVNSMGFHYIRRIDKHKLTSSEISSLKKVLTSAGIKTTQIEYDISDRWIGFKISGRFSTHGNIDSVKDVKPDAGYKLIGDKYNWELEGKAKNKKDALAKFKRRYPESYNTWGEELEYLARIGKDFESEPGEWALHFRFDDDGYFYICVIEFAKRYQDSTTDATMRQYEFKFIANEIDGEIITISFPCLSNEAAIATLRRRWTWTKMISVKIDGKEVKYQNGKIIDSEETQMKDKLIDIPSNLLSKLEDMFKQKNIHVARKGKTFTGRIHYQVEFGGSVRDLVRKLEEIEKTAKSLNIPMTFAADGNDDDTFATAGVDFDKQYVADSDVEDGKNAAENAVESAMKELGITKEQLSSKRKDVEMKISSKGLYGRTQAGWFVDDYIKNYCKDSEELISDDEDLITKAINDEVTAIELYNQILAGDLDDETRAIIEEIRDDENDHLVKLTKLKNNVGSDEDIVEDDEEKVDDAIQTFEIRWIDTYKKSKGYVKEEYLHIDKIKANSLSEALKKLADNVALMGVGTMNAMVISIHSDKTSYMYSGKLGELVRKVKDSSKIERAVKAIRAMRKL